MRRGSPSIDVAVSPQSLAFHSQIQHQSTGLSSLELKAVLSLSQGVVDSSFIQAIVAKLNADLGDLEELPEHEGTLEPTEPRATEEGEEADTEAVVDKYLFEELGPSHSFIRLEKAKDPRAFHAVLAICAMDEARIPRGNTSKSVDLIDVNVLRRLDSAPRDHGSCLHTLAYMMQRHKISMEALKQVVEEYPSLDLNSPSVTFEEALDYITKCAFVAKVRAAGRVIPEGYMDRLPQAADATADTGGQEALEALALVAADVQETGEQARKAKKVNG